MAVEEERAVIVVDGSSVEVSMLRSHQTDAVPLNREVGMFSLEHAGRRLEVAGLMDQLVGLRLKTLHDFGDVRF